jgi:plasmid stabilization system protein ParE
LKSVNVQPRADAEADEAATWYEAEQPGLGVEFLLELDAAIERAAESPLAYARVCLDARRVLMRRFPFAVYFLQRGRAARAPFHYARASRWTRGPAAADLRR